MGIPRTSSQVVCICIFFSNLPPDLISSDTLTRTGSRGSDSSSTGSEDNSSIPPPHGFQHSSLHQQVSAAVYSESSDDGEAGDETRDLPAVREVSQQQRSSSSLSFSSRYKTPQTGSFALSSPPPRRMSVPPMQPLPNFATPSAFTDPQTTVAYTSSTSYAALLSSRDPASQSHPADPPYRSHTTTSRHSTTTGAYLRPPSQTAAPVSLEYAMENVQAHIAALTERIDTLESSLATHTQPQAISSPRTSSGRGSPADSRSVSQVSEWDIEDMGLWTLVLKPLFRNLSYLQRLLVFFLKGGQDRSPVLVIVRRLCLDISFVMVVLSLLRTVWIKSGTRRKEVGTALTILWAAVTGRKRVPGAKKVMMLVS